MKIIKVRTTEDDPTQRKPDMTLARKLLDWEPKVSRSEGLKITYQYFKSLPEEKLYKKEHNDFERYIRK